MADMEIQPLQDLELLHLAENIGPNDWRRLGLFLGLSEPRLANWERQFMLDVEKAISTMLFAWHNNQDPCAERKLLVTALESSRLRNLADKIKKGFYLGSSIPGMKPVPPPNLLPNENNVYLQQQPQPQPHQPAPPQYKVKPCVYQQTATLHQPAAATTKPEVSEILLRDLSQKLGSEWKSVGTYLGFENQTIQILQEQYPVVQECIFQMLLQWRNEKGVNARKAALVRALERSGRSDLTEFVNEHEDL